MSYSYDDGITRAIMTRFAPDISTALQHASPLTLLQECPRVQLPVTAAAKVICDAGVGGFIVDATLYNNNPDKWLRGRAVFSAFDVISSRDAAGLLRHIFDKLKHDFINDLAKGEVERLLNERLEKAINDAD